MPRVPLFQNSATIQTICCQHPRYPRNPERSHTQNIQPVQVCLDRVSGSSELSKNRLLILAVNTKAPSAFWDEPVDTCTSILTCWFARLGGPVDLTGTPNSPCVFHKAFQCWKVKSMTHMFCVPLLYESPDLVFSKPASYTFRSHLTNAIQGFLQVILSTKAI